MKEKIVFKVSVPCMTYNHAAYIEDTMNGFCMQRTTFPFVCIIMDDASTDGEQSVIQKYLEDHFDISEKGVLKKEETDDYKLIIARHRENCNCWFAVFFLKYNHYRNPELKKKKGHYFSELESSVDYIALCEGDDYWIDPNKLQMQFDLLEHNKDCSICFHRVQAVSSNKEKLPLKIPKVEWTEKKVDMNEHIYEQYHRDFCFQTSSFFVRREIMAENGKMREGIFKTFPVGDIPIIWTALLNAHGYYIPVICSCYRRFSGGYTSRVVANPSYAIALNEKFITSFGLFDRYTDFHYHEELEYAITRHELNLILLEKNPLKLAKIKYIAFFRERGVKFTILYLWSFFPFRFNMLTKLDKLKSFLTNKRN